MNFRVLPTDIHMVRDLLRQPFVRRQLIYAWAPLVPTSFLGDMLNIIHFINFLPAARTRSYGYTNTLEFTHRFTLSSDYS